MSPPPERRRFLGMALCASAAAQSGNCPEAAAAAAGTIRVTREGSQQIVYDLATARDAGAFQGAGFVQQCFVLPRSSALPALGVWYRPDADGRRHEVVLELSDAFARQAFEPGGYTVVLEIGGRTVLSGAVPRHFWSARWRLQSAPRPRYRAAADLVRAGLVPAYRPGERSGAAAQPYQPMGIAGVMAYMPTTGERDDIGLFPAWTAEFLAHGDEAGWQRMLANAEACATFPWHWRDETGQVFNIDRHPDWSIDPRFAPADKVPAWPASRDQTAPVVDDAHQPQLTCVPYLLTGDPYFLEELQFQANWHMWSHGSQNGLGLLSNSQVRGLAWTLRQVALAAAATPDSVPSWLLPRDYFLRKLENNRRWLAEQTVDSIDPLAQTFRFPWVNDLTMIASWQEDFITLVLGQIVRMGFTGWRPIHDWACSNLVARGSGGSGWPRGVPVWYFVNALGPDGVPATDWAALARLNEAILKPPKDGGLGELDGNYLGTYLATMRLAAWLGHNEMLPILAWYENHASVRPTQKYLISPEPGPPVPPQPGSAGDRQFRSSLQRLPPRPGTYMLASGAASVIGSGGGQTLKVDSPNEFWQATPHAGGVVVFNNTHAGGSVIVKDVQVVAFAGNSFDVATGQWTGTRSR